MAASTFGRPSVDITRSAASARRLAPRRMMFSRRGRKWRAAEISTSYAERSNLSIRMACPRFTRLTNGFSKKLENHAAAIDPYVAHYNFCRVHESLRSTPAMALGIADRVWTIGDLLDAALAVAPSTPTEPTPQDRRKGFRVIEGGKG